MKKIIQLIKKIFSTNTTTVEEAKTYAETTPVSDKERATALGEPWVAVLDTKVNSDNPRNGFFELDWNEHFVTQLKETGFPGNTDEEIVDSWFRTLCRDIGSDEGMDMDRRNSGYINVNRLDNGKTEVS